MKTAITSILVLLSLLTFGENKWTFTAKDKKVIEEAVSEIPDSTRQRFEKRYKDWKHACDTNHRIKLSSRSDASKEVEEYKTLIKMGDIILPLLIQKMSEDISRNFFDLVPYNELQKNTDLKINALMSEQDKAYQTVLFWIMDRLSSSRAK